jgi:hypothetical protein
MQEQGMRRPVPLSEAETHFHQDRCLERSNVMFKLYKSSCHPRLWIAYLPGSGWVMFPIAPNGWEKRQPARGLDPMHLRQVPATEALAAGFPVELKDSELQAA